MGAVSINSIRDGIKSVLMENYPDIPVRDEVIEEGLNAPYLFVRLDLVRQKQELKFLYRRMHSFDICFYAKDNEIRAMHDMAEQLYDSMDMIMLGEARCSGTNMHHRITDGVLHFYVEYTFIVRRSEPEYPVMRTMKQEGHINE